MKYLLYLVGILYIIATILFVKLFLLDKKIELNQIENSIAIIIPEEKLINYNTNPRGAFEENKNYGIGAGFIINSDGKIQTVNHLVENENINYKVILNNKEYDSEVISRDKENDLAILKIKTSNDILFPLLTKERVSGWYVGEETISYGVDIKNLKIIYNTGTLLNTKSKLDSKSNLLEISNILKPGFSGGPIINSEGKVIGVNYAISEGRNYGISFSK